MSSSRTLLRAAASIRPSTTTTFRRALNTNPILNHKESSQDTTDNVSRHKADLLDKHKHNKAHWKPELASDSEEAVRADKHGGAKEDVKTLQERTKGHAEEKTKAGGTSSKDGF